jgi:hypothetical protein
LERLPKDGYNKAMPIYLAERLFQSITDLVQHWYAGGFHFFAGRTFDILRFLDRTFAVRVSVVYIFHPLYQDRSFLGYFFGFFLRLFKIITGGLLYAVVAAVMASLYAIWAIIPVYIVVKIIGFDSLI